MERKLAAILATDIVGFAGLVLDEFIQAKAKCRSLKIRALNTA